MKPSHRLATSVAAVAAVAAAVLVPATADEASYRQSPATQVHGSASAAMSSSATRRSVTKRRLRIRTYSTITVGEKLVVSGRATLRRARVRLQLRQSGRWRKVDRARTGSRGAFRVSESVEQEGRHRFRVVVTPRRGRKAKAAFRVTVRPRTTEPTEWPTEDPTPTTTGTPTPTVASPPTPTATTGAGSSDDWSYITGGTDPLAWNSCSVITWSYDPAGEYPGALADWQRAFDIVAERSGLPFEYGGTSGVMKISWSDAARDPQLSGGVVGFGGPSYRYIDPLRNNGVRMLIVGGRVILDRETALSPGHATSGRAAWGQVMVHELIHAVGLGHARGREQIMYPSTGALALGAGDNTGLHSVGSSRGCLSASQYDSAKTSAVHRGEVLVFDELRHVS